MLTGSVCTSLNGKDTFLKTLGIYPPLQLCLQSAASCLTLVLVSNLLTLPHACPSLPHFCPLQQVPPSVSHFPRTQHLLHHPAWDTPPPKDPKRHPLPGLVGARAPIFPTPTWPMCMIHPRRSHPSMPPTPRPTPPPLQGPRLCLRPPPPPLKPHLLRFAQSHQRLGLHLPLILKLHPKAFSPDRRSSGIRSPPSAICSTVHPTLAAPGPPPGLLPIG